MEGKVERCRFPELSRLLMFAIVYSCLTLGNDAGYNCSEIAVALESLP